MDDIPVPVDSRSSRFIPRLRSFIRQKGLAYSTEKTYVHWILNYIRFHNMKHPEEMGPEQVDEFLTHLPLNQNVAPGTQRIALNALVFLYQQVEGALVAFLHSFHQQLIDVGFAHFAMHSKILFRSLVNCRPRRRTRR